MNRYRAYWPLDDAPLKDGDAQFFGVEERLDADQLPPGRVARATNCRFRAGVVEPRRGISILRWMKANGAQPFTSEKKADFFQIAPPATYQDWVGNALYSPNGVNDVIIGCRLGEIQTISYVGISVSGGGFWDTAGYTGRPLGVIKEGSLVATAATPDLNVTGQDFQFAGDLTDFYGQQCGGNGYGYLLTITLVLADSTGITGYVNYSPY